MTTSKISAKLRSEQRIWKQLSVTRRNCNIERHAHAESKWNEGKHRRQYDYRVNTESKYK